MTLITNTRIIFNKFITGDGIVPGQTTVVDTAQSIDLDNAVLNGGVLIKTLSLSLEPLILARVRTTSPGAMAFKIGEPIFNYGVGIVLRSENPAFQVGDYLRSANFPFAEYSIQQNVDRFEKLDNKHNVPLSAYIGIAGMPGMTAYTGWKEYSRAKKGEVAFVTSGAGAVGSLVIQLAKRDGMKVIASAGSDEKVDFMKELGADVAFNYKTTKTAEILEKEGPIDVYWDNVGGETLEAAINAAARYARFIECGMLSGYGGKSHAVPNLFQVVAKELSINGFIVASLAPKYREAFNQEIPALVASKELKYREDITKGLDGAMEAFVKLMKGDCIGKSIVVVANE